MLSVNECWRFEIVGIRLCVYCFEPVIIRLVSCPKVFGGRIGSTFSLSFYYLCDRTKAFMIVSSHTQVDKEKRPVLTCGAS